MRVVGFIFAITCLSVVAIAQNMEIALPKPGGWYYTVPGIPLRIKDSTAVSGVLWQLSTDNGASFSPPRTTAGIWSGRSQYFDQEVSEQCVMWVSGVARVPNSSIRAIRFSPPTSTEEAEKVVIPRDKRSVIVTYPSLYGLSIIDLASGTQRSVLFDISTLRPFAISRDGRYCAAGYKNNRLLTAVYEVNALDKPVYSFPNGIGSVAHCAFIGDSRELVTASGVVLTRYDSDGIKVAERQLRSKITGLFPAPDSSLILVATEGGMMLVEVEGLDDLWSVSSMIDPGVTPFFSSNGTLFSYRADLSPFDRFEVRSVSNGRLVRTESDIWSYRSVMLDADHEIAVMFPYIVNIDHTRGKRCQSLGTVDDGRESRLRACQWDDENDSLLIATGLNLYLVATGSEPWYLSGETQGTFSLINEDRPPRALVATIGSVTAKIGTDTSFTYRLIVDPQDEMTDSANVELELEWDGLLALPIAPSPIGVMSGSLRRIRVPIQIQKDAEIYTGTVAITTALGPRTSSAIMASKVYVNSVAFDVYTQPGKITIEDTCLRYPTSNSFFENLSRYSVVWRENRITIDPLDGADIDMISVSDISGIVVPTTIIAPMSSSGPRVFSVPRVASGVYVVAVYSRGRCVATLVNKTEE
ncbi:MAG: hypothetical protein IPP80_07470 [Ignavibacteria bacterium]|nr:hypothetical protein [Ignavibacteria bacterium]